MVTNVSLLMASFSYGFSSNGTDTDGDLFCFYLHFLESLSFKGAKIFGRNIDSWGTIFAELGEEYQLSP